MNKFLEKCELSQLNQYDIKSLNNSAVQAVINILPAKKSPELDSGTTMLPERQEKFNQ